MTFFHLHILDYSNIHDHVCNFIWKTFYITLQLCNKIPYAASRNVFAGSLKIGKHATFNFSKLYLRYYLVKHTQFKFFKWYICSAQSENLTNSWIVLLFVRIPTLADRVRNLTLCGSIPELYLHEVWIGTKWEYLSIVTWVCIFANKGM